MLHFSLKIDYVKSSGCSGYYINSDNCDFFQIKKRCCVSLYSSCNPFLTFGCKRNWILDFFKRFQKFVFGIKLHPPILFCSEYFEKVKQILKQLSEAKFRSLVNIPLGYQNYYYSLTDCTSAILVWDFTFQPRKCLMEFEHLIKTINLRTLYFKCSELCTLNEAVFSSLVAIIVKYSKRNLQLHFDICCGESKSLRNLLAFPKLRELTFYDLEPVKFLKYDQIKTICSFHPTIKRHAEYRNYCIIMLFVARVLKTSNLCFNLVTMLDDFIKLRDNYKKDLSRFIED